MTVPKVKALACPGCGGAVQIRTFEHAITVVCENCGSVLDAKDPGLRVLQAFEAKVARRRPKIPLGTRGKLHGQPWEVVGFQTRTIRVEGVAYSWDEYVLFNPYRGFRYLSEYQGHWNDVVPLKVLPKPGSGMRGATATHSGATYRHFQTAQAETTFVLGEFPWQVRVGDLVTAADYVAPPRMLSSETTEDETTWSLGEYVPGERLWQAFGLKGKPPAPVGVFANQPSPHGGRMGAYWKAFGILAAALLLLFLGRAATASRRELFSYSGTYQFRPHAADAEAPGAFVTDVFDVPGHTSNLELTIETDLSNAWAYFDFALINDATGTALDFGREVSYYYGRDSDGSWTEGSRRDRVLLPEVPPGRYYLRVAPDVPESPPGYVTYRLRLRRDVPSPMLFGLTLLLLAVPPALLAFRGASFEVARWRESDHPLVQSSDDE
ncbi:MAG TPA: DUF4178 domain-containing protein [Gemmatimonadaceae bacterium]|nr:DUF4178 domain-containing protein [Gemmatimonadaceae bacterium]